MASRTENGSDLRALDASEGKLVWTDQSQTLYLTSASGETRSLASGSGIGAAQLAGDRVVFSMLSDEPSQRARVLLTGHDGSNTVELGVVASPPARLVTSGRHGVVLGDGRAFSVDLSQPTPALVLHSEVTTHANVARVPGGLIWGSTSALYVWRDADTEPTRLPSLAESTSSFAGLDDGTLLATYDEGELRKLVRLAPGATQWSLVADLDRQAFLAGAADAHALLLRMAANTDPRTLEAVDPISGQQAWSLDLGSRVENILVDGDTLVWSYRAYECPAVALTLE